MEWIACSERMPESGWAVLVCTSFGERAAAWYDAGYWVIVPSGHCWHEKLVTHWMPLPPPPITGTGL